MTDDLAGRTIVRVEGLGDYRGVRLHFTDGTYAEIEGYGESSSEVTIEWFSHEARRRRAAREQGKRELRRVQKMKPIRKSPLPSMGPAIKNIWTRPDPFQAAPTTFDGLKRSR